MLRIFPLYYLCLLIFIVLLPKVLKTSYDAAYYHTNQVWFWTYLQNWLYIFKHPEESTLLNHLWSLALEEQFYLVWPLVMFFVHSAKLQLKLILGALGLVVVLRIVLWITEPYQISYSTLYTFSRIDGLCIGSSLSLLRKIEFHLTSASLNRLLKLIIGSNIVVWLFISLFNLDIPYIALFGYPSIAVVFGIVLIKAIATESNIVNRHINKTPLRLLGKLSYSLYIFHWPIYLGLFPLAKHFFDGWLLTSGYDNQLLSACIATLCAILVSMASYRYMEKYFLALKNVVA
jgi:peptidoglycan/LPS O-acetylase OafA/YrhL